MNKLNAKISDISFQQLFLVKTLEDVILVCRYRTSSDSKALYIGQNFGGGMSKGKKILDTKSENCDWMRSYKFFNAGGYQFSYQKINGNYRTFYEGQVSYEGVDKDYLITTNETMMDTLYNYLMTDEKYLLPLLKEWVPYIYGEAIKVGALQYISNERAVLCDKKERRYEDVLVHGEQKIPLKDVVVLCVEKLTGEHVRRIVSKGLADREIFLDPKQRPQKKIEVGGMDEYHAMFGKSICEQLEKEKIQPKSRNLVRSVDGLALLSRKLYPQQAGCTEGIIQSMESGDSYIYVSEGMGCGKTIQAASAIEARYNRKWLREHPGKTLKDCFESKEVIYRVLVLCPPHLCKKWKYEVESQIPGAVGIIVSSLSQLEALRMRGPKERRGKEFYIFSREFAKGDTFKCPVPNKMGYKLPVVGICKDCLDLKVGENNAEHQKYVGRRVLRSDELTRAELPQHMMKMINGQPTCISCGGHRQRLMELYVLREVEEGNFTYNYSGICCPRCNQLLMRRGTEVPMEEEKLERRLLDVTDFAGKGVENSFCHLCGEALWGDSIVNYDIDLFGNRTPRSTKSKWHKIKYAGDCAKLKQKDVRKRLNKSGWALVGYEEALLSKKAASSEYLPMDRENGPRRYSPARYAKKYLKGYFDVMIADEAHEYEGTGSAQTIACHNLMKTVDYTMLLTGTLTNGTASSLFNLAYMVDPKLMKELGYDYTKYSADMFAETYGVVEKEFEMQKDGTGLYNVQGKGRQIDQARVRPGISPLIYPKLLLNHTVQLNIENMSNHLCPLKEWVHVIPMNEDQLSGYRSNIDEIKTVLRGPAGAGLMPKMLQLGLSYPDKPYEREPIWSLKLKDFCVVTPKNLTEYQSVERLLPKEEKLVEIINQEISENRNVFVYTEYTGKEEMDVDYRLQEVIEKHCHLKGQVSVLKGKKVKSSEREEYIRKHSDKIRVWICNYRLVDTGIDFVGEYDGRKFNYPTIIYFQTGAQLSRVWQASRRHYRLNQTEECRTYYLVYKGTFQMDMLELMAKKISAASAIQGNFSENALVNMGGMEDPMVVIAKRISSGQHGGESDVDIQSQLTKTRELAVQTAQLDENVYVGDEPLTYYDIMGVSASATSAAGSEVFSMSGFTFGTVGENSVMQPVFAESELKPRKTRRKKEVLEVQSLLDFDVNDFLATLPQTEREMKIGGRKVLIGQTVLIA